MYRDVLEIIGPYEFLVKKISTFPPLLPSPLLSSPLPSLLLPSSPLLSSPPLPSPPLPSPSPSSPLLLTSKYVVGTGLVRIRLSKEERKETERRRKGREICDIRPKDECHSKGENLRRRVWGAGERGRGGRGEGDGGRGGEGERGRGGEG